MKDTDYKNININIRFEGYWNSTEKLLIPSASGIYCVYEGKYQSEEKYSDQINFQRLIYIGESDDVQQAITCHEDYDLWLCQLRRHHQLFFSFGEASPADYKRALAGLIYQHQPDMNTEYREDFPFGDTTMLLIGKNKLLKNYFTVYERNVYIVQQRVGQGQQGR